MATLQLSAHFWTLRDDVIIPDCDLGAFKYQSGKDADLLSGPYGQLKRGLCRSRDQVTTPSNKRPSRLRDNLIELEELFAHYTVAHVAWSVAEHGSALVVFSNGFIVHITSNLQQSDIIDIVIDKSLEGKLLADIVDACTCPGLLVIAHGIPQLTLIFTHQPVFQTAGRPLLLGQCNVTASTVQLPGPNTRRQERKVLLDSTNANVCVWWEREGGELFAWAPVVRAEDRANILIYSTTSNCQLVACHYTEHNPFVVDFSARDVNQLRVAELLSTTKGRLNVQFTIFGIQQPLKPIQRRLVRIPALPRCHSHSPDEQILLLGCVDGSVIAWDVTKDTTLTYKSSFIPFHLAWHGSSAFFTVCGERGQLQCWDRALNPLLLRTHRNGNTDGSSVLHLQQYLRHQPSVLAVKWPALVRNRPSEDNHATAERPFPFKSVRSIRKKSRRLPSAPAGQSSAGSQNKSPSHHLLVCFERGPVVCLRFLAGCWPTTSALDSLSLCSEYLLYQQPEQAVQHLLSLKWTNIRNFQEEDAILSCMIRVVNDLLRHNTPMSDALLQRAVISLMERTAGDESLAEPVLDAARRCCRTMLRRRSNRLEMAAAYALRLQDADLLVELILHARKMGDQSLVSRATAILDCVRPDGLSTTGSSSTSSSRSSYTTSSSSSSDTTATRSCSTCSEATDATDGQPSNHQMANLCLDDSREDQVHVISFGVV